MTNLREAEVTPSGLESLLAFFHDELADVAFPGVDAEVLAGAARRVQDAVGELRRVERELDAARAALSAAREDAVQKGQRAIAYARVYAADQPELLARLAQVALPGSGTTTSEGVLLAPAPRKRGRPPKSATVTPLFAAPRGEAEVEPMNEARAAE